ncbi:hypothetical protein [Streptomyces sp. NEAU-sy36]|uniref:hypothetical protein n=1 Tax=Streptomyces sp. NEAU-sy36 TaxID=2751189 RepID=UPI00214BFEE1|nr:hypothetical protein [Streptomyces sp. NEAU-sy36]
MTRYAGAARWAFNHAFGMKVAAHQQWRREVQALVDQGVPEAEARKRLRVPVPSKPQTQSTSTRSRATPASKGSQLVRTGRSGRARGGTR